MKKYALTIGIGYSKSRVSPLNGTITDSLNMTTLLRDHYDYNVVNMNDKQYLPSSALYPSLANIVQQMISVCKKVKDGDHLVITYAGHGIQLEQTTFNPEEIDGRDEAIIPADYVPDQKNKKALTDDRIYRILQTHLAGRPNTKVFMLFDCCHSGTIVDLRYTFNYDGKNFDRIDNNIINLIDPKIIMISGCKDAEVSWSDYISFNGGGRTMQGVLTGSFIHTVKTNPKSIKNIFELVKSMYPFVIKYKQNPQISSNQDISDSSNLEDISILDTIKLSDAPPARTNNIIVPPHKEQLENVSKSIVDTTKKINVRKNPNISSGFLIKYLI